MNKDVKRFSNWGEKNNDRRRSIETPIMIKKVDSNIEKRYNEKMVRKKMKFIENYQ